MDVQTAIEMLARLERMAVELDAAGVRVVAHELPGSAVSDDCTAGELSDHTLEKRGAIWEVGAVDLTSGVT